MPLALDKKPSRREKVDPRDTYGYTTPDIQPAARPTDPYVRPEPAKKMTAVSELLNALETFGSAYEKHQYEKEREAVAQGEDDFNTGQAPPEGAHEARLRKYNELRGKAASFEFYKDAMDLYAKNKMDDPETLAGKMQGLIQQYQQKYGTVGTTQSNCGPGKTCSVKGNPGADFMKGFAPRAQEIIHQVDALHANQRAKDYEDEVMSNARSIISGVLEQKGIDDPQGIRGTISDIQNNAKALGLTRTQISEMAFDILAARAIVTGDSRFIAPLTIRDASGQSIADVVGAEKVGALLNRTESIAHSRWSMEKTMKKEQENEAQAKVMNGLLREFHTLDKTNLQGHLELKNKILSYATPEGNPEGIALDPSQFHHLNTLIEGRTGKGGWAEESDPEVLVDTLRKAKLGQIKVEDITAKRDKLSHGDAKVAIGYLLTHEDKMQDQAEREADARWKEGQKRSVKLLVGEKNPLFGQFMTSNEKGMEEQTIRWYQEEQEAWLEANPGKHPTSADVSTIIDKVQKRKEADPKWNTFQPMQQPLGGPGRQGDSATGNAIERLQNLKKQQQQKQSFNQGQLKSMMETQLANTGITNVPLELALAVAGQESGGDAQAVSPKGAGGIMQLMPDTAKGLGVNNVFDPMENIRGGLTYLSQMYDKFKDWSLALAAYNAGPHKVEKYKGIPPYAETRQYVAKVMERYGKIMASKLYHNSTG